MGGSDKRHAFLNLPTPLPNNMATGCHDLHVLSGLGVNAESVAHDINDSDIAVGWAEIGGEKHAVVWRIDLYDPLGTPPIPRIDLGLLDEDDSTYSVAFAINDESPFPIIVGESDVHDDCTCGGGNFPVARGYWVALTFPPPTLAANAIPLVHDNFTMGCKPLTSTRDVNTPADEFAPTVAAGLSAEAALGPCNGDDVEAGTFWEDGAPVGVDLASLPEETRWVARGVSDLGAVVGNNISFNWALYWDDTAAAPLNIGSKVESGSWAQRINNNDPSTDVLAVAGWNNSPGADRAVLWECIGDCTDLANWTGIVLNGEQMPDCSGWNLRRADDVNDDGKIIGWATFDPGIEHAVLLEPLVGCCPEDQDRDGDVDFTDLSILQGNFGSCPTCRRCISDIDCDGDVDRFDQAFIIAMLVGGGGCGGGSSASAAEQAAGQMGFGSVGALAAWMTEVDNGQALGAGYVFSALGQAFLDE